MAGVRDELLITQVFHTERLASGQRVSFGQRRDQPIAAPLLEFYTGLLHGRAQQREIDLPD